MEIKLEDAGPCRKIMYVSAPAQAVASEYNAVVKAYAKTAKIPGFRPGRAPANVVERRYGKGIVEEAKDRLVPRFYREALSLKRIEPVAIVKVSDVIFEKEQGLTFKVTIDMPPEFKLPKYRKISLKRKKIEVKDKDVDEAFDRFLERFSRFENVTRLNIMEGDLVMLDYSGECDGRPVAELAPDSSGLGDGKDFWTLAGEPEFLPGFSAGLIGATINEETEIKVHFPLDYHVPALAGKDAVYKVFAKAIREQVRPEINEEFLKKCEVESSEALRDKVQNNLLESAQRSEENALKNEIAQFLLKETEFEPPLSIVEQETSFMIRNIVERITNEGATTDQINERKEDIVNEASRSSKERVKLSYILDRIADGERIEVEESEINNRIESIAGYYNIPSSRFRAELDKKNGAERIKRELRAEKTLNFLLEKAKIK